MRVVVCVRQGLDGEISPFDGCAYEQALRIEGAEVILLSMGAPSVRDFLHRLTRLGASEAILLSDSAFAGADTLATAYTLSLALKKLSPDIVLCGRQTLVGDTAQTGAMLSVFMGSSLITNVLSVEAIEDSSISCNTRNEGMQTASFPALLTVERINSLRLPRLGSKPREVKIWNAKDIEADVQRTGLKGSPTRVVASFENTSGKRKCTFITKEDLPRVIKEALERKTKATESSPSEERLSGVCVVGKAPEEFVRRIANDYKVIELTDADDIIEKITEYKPSAVIWGSDTKSKRLSATVAARLGLGLCADCTSLAFEGGEIMMYRPALSGSVIAKIKSLTVPTMATVRTEENENSDIVVAAGVGVKKSLERVREFANEYRADICATRRLVDEGLLPYEAQVGLTGKVVAPPVYIAIGISGAVHHIAGMQRSGVVIAINPDKNAPIFEYSDYGITEEF